MTKKKEAAKKEVAKKPATKRPTASQKLKIANEKVELLTADNERLVLENTRLNRANELNRKEIADKANRLVECHHIIDTDIELRKQLFKDVDSLVDNYKKSNWFMRMANAGKILKSLIRLFKYYKQAINEA
jgi:putative lipase involved disintegration of autophagic bodies